MEEEIKRRKKKTFHDNTQKIYVRTNSNPDKNRKEKKDRLET